MRHPFRSLMGHESRGLADCVAYARDLNTTFDWIVVDHYELDASWERAARESGCAQQILVVDDLANRFHDCEVLVDPGKFRTAKDYARLMQRKAELLLGTQYAFLKPAYFQMHGASPVWPTVKRVHIFFGGGSPAEWLPFYVRATLEADDEVSVLAVGDAEARAMQHLVALYPGRLEWHPYAENMADLYAQCDLSIGSPGTATWERACVGLPAGLLATSENQMPILDELSREGFCAYFGPAWALDEAGYKTKFLGLIDDSANLLSMRREGLDAVDGAGAMRVARLLTGREDQHV